MTPEHQINQGDVGTPIIDTITFASAINLTGASIQFVYHQTEATENIVRAATIVSSSPSAAAATSAKVERNLSAADVLTPNVYVYEWKVTLADGSVLVRPLSAPTADFPDRARPCFEIVASLSPVNETSTDGPSQTDFQLLEWAEGENFELTAINYDADGVVTTATVLWPDRSGGVFTTTTKNTTFLDFDAFTITHIGSGKTITQSAVTRDSSGNVTIKPALTIS